MTAYKKTRIIVETEKVLILRRRGCVRRWCPECGREVDMTGLAQAAALTGVAQGCLRDHARIEKWHLAEESGEEPLICLDSLLGIANPTA